MGANLLSDGEKMMFDILVACQENSVHRTHNWACSLCWNVLIVQRRHTKKTGEF